MSDLKEEKAKINEVVGQLAGAASLCWNPTPTGVFDSEQASKFTDEASLEIRVMIHEARMGMLEYFDQVPNNSDMDWKRLFADTRKNLAADAPEVSND